MNDKRAALKALILQAQQFLKSVDGLVTGYVDDITRNFQDVLDGDLLSSEARRRHKAYIKENAEAAYREGLAEGGANIELTEDDEKAIGTWVQTQLGYVAGLWDEIDRLTKGYSDAMLTREQYESGRRALYERIGLWGNALRDLANQGKASAMRNKMVTWRLGATEEHCRTCAKLDGKRHRLSWFTSRDYIPQAVGSDTLECGGWRCQCTLKDDKGAQVLP